MMLVKREQNNTYSDFSITDELRMTNKIVEQVFFNILCYFSTTMTYTNKPWAIGSERSVYR